MEINVTQNIFLIFFYVPQNEEHHKGLEQHEGK